MGDAGTTRGGAWDRPSLASARQERTVAPALPACPGQGGANQVGCGRSPRFEVSGATTTATPTAAKSHDHFAAAGIDLDRLGATVAQTRPAQRAAI